MAEQTERETRAGQETRAGKARPAARQGSKTGRSRTQAQRKGGERRRRPAQKAATKAASLWTPANIVTCVRIVLLPVWLVIAETARLTGALGQNSLISWASFLLYVLISLTDKLDGYLARSRGEVTDFGKFLDPIADKLAVIGAFIYLIELGLVPSWVVLLVIAREFLVSGLRMVVASKGVVVAASNLGKWKTALTMVGICALLLAVCLPAGTIATVVRWIGFVTMLGAVVLTAWSGVDYFVKCWPYVSGEA